MSRPVYSTFTQWDREGHPASYAGMTKSPGGILNLVEGDQPAGAISDPAVPDLILSQNLLGGSRVSGNMGWGRFNVTSEKGGFFLSAPNFAHRVMIDTQIQFRSVSFPVVQWKNMLDEATDGPFSPDHLRIYGGTFSSQILRSALRNLWALSDEEGAPSRLLARAAGCEILAELYRLGGTPFKSAKGGLAPWAERRSLELIRARLSEDISLEELAAEARLSPFHFARMFKQSFGVPPRVYLTRLRMEKACELLERTNLPITEIALEVGYSSNQVLARIFTKHQRMTPTVYRRAVRRPASSIGLP